jgi:hypothetical protein
MTRATLIAGAGAGLLTLLLLAPATGTALGKLAQARADRMAAAALARTPATRPPLLPSALRVRAANEAEAGRVVAARLRARAASAGVLVEQADRVRGGGGLVRLRLRLSGPDKAVVALADRLEREAPLLRFTRWRVGALPDGGARLDGEAVAAWR